MWWWRLRLVEVVPPPWPFSDPTTETLNSSSSSVKRKKQNIYIGVILDPVLYAKLYSKILNIWYIWSSTFSKLAIMYLLHRKLIIFFKGMFLEYIVWMYLYFLDHFVLLHWYVELVFESVFFLLFELVFLWSWNHVQYDAANSERSAC